MPSIWFTNFFFKFHIKPTWFNPETRLNVFGQRLQMNFFSVKWVNLCCFKLACVLNGLSQVSHTYLPEPVACCFFLMLLSTLTVVSNGISSECKIFDWSVNFDF